MNWPAYPRCSMFLSNRDIAADFGPGLRLAAVCAPIGAVIGEWVGAFQDLGYLMLLANGRARTDLIFAALFVPALFILLLHKEIARLADHLTRRARGWLWLAD